jgi:alpha-1,6-mannosyltransferase
VLDAALFYGERSGGIRTYLDAKRVQLARRDDVDHHVVVPGRVERHGADGLHELPGLRVAATNGYRLPYGTLALRRLIAELRPDVVLLHDPFWGPVSVAQCAHRVGAKVIGVHHGSSELDAALFPGPSRVYARGIRVWMRRAYRPLDAVMSVVDTRKDTGRDADLPLRLGLHEAFRPRDVRRGDHVLYVGRFSREKGVLALLEAAARSREPWALRLVGSGHLEDHLALRAERLGIADRVTILPYVSDRDRLARLYAGARCVVMPGEHETFGLVGLEAAACGARVVACETAPSAAACGPLAHTFAAGDVAGLRDAIDAARAADVDPVAAGALAWGHRWERVFEREVAGIRELLR